MNLGEKLRKHRKKAGLSQEELAEKLSVSRQAITKWESNRGLPSIESLQNISKLFDVSIDYLLDEKGTVTSNSIREAIDLSQYQKIGKCRNKYDAVAKQKFPKALCITPLIRHKKLSKIEWIIDFIVQPGVLNVADSLNDQSAYYLVETELEQLLVHVTKDFIESTGLANKFTKRKKVIGSNIFIKATYTL